MAATYEPIATTTLGSAQSSVTFSAISGSFTDLVLIIDGSFTAGGGIDTQFNGDTGSNYSRTRIYGTGAGVVSNRSTNAGTISHGYISTSRSNTIINIFNYANTTTYKTSIGRGNAADARVQADVGLWRSTAAITSITLFGGTFTIGTTFTLYGIKAAV